MKEFILIAGLFLATIGFANASNNASVCHKKITPVEFVKNNETTPYVITFYEIDRIKIKNEKNYLIRIYDADYNLIKETTGDVYMCLTPGKYYVACEKRIKTNYISLD